MAEEKEKIEESQEAKEEQIQGTPEAQTQPEGEKLPADIRNMAMLCHLLGIFPGIFGLIGPLIIWLVKKDSHPFINDNGKAAINFIISMIIYYMISFVLTLIVIGALLLPVLVVLQIVFVIIGALRASEGKVYRYPIAINFLK